MKVMLVMGTRPEAIKLAPVIDALKAASIQTTICATGQHREMLDQALQIFAIEPDVSLSAMQTGQTLNSLAARLLTGMDIALDRHRPDWVLVQGDTTTAFCSGLAAFHRGIPVGHVEAGLRTGDLSNPFPEEANRSLLARIATLHFTPTQKNRQALLAEGIPATAIHVTGNTVVDAMQKAHTLANVAQTAGRLPILETILKAAQDRSLALVTCHRRENLGSVLENICHTLKRLCERHADLYWVFPVHLNPNVQKPAKSILAGIPNLCLLDPVDYLTSLALIARASLILSDSGGIQEEAPAFGVPVIVMRKHTERQEGIAAGFATLAGQTPENIEAAVDEWLSHPERRKKLKNSANPYGDGRAAQRIAALLQGRTTGEFIG
ncbi:MAG: UDP-N-acetylglucosamine 2-epimerase (non-hydrolyzing) [Azoarcus sp.]|jgi:UDP-N-acetylglucosamine 2-epimerase (non-hydrolysing)|nr:UDP-N-acetylglucosamine 2-epimerase (non-hydrolyzing) [Azoarcus sp.]